MAAGTVIELITQIAGAVSAVAAATALLIKPADILPAPGGKKDLPI